MSKIMLVNVTHVEESRVAVLDEGVLAAYEIETTNRASLKGNIYNAVVESIHPSLEASFVRIGPDLKGFLPIDEVNFKLLPARTDSRKSGRIGQHLHPGQKLMAQVVREPFAEKPPTVSTYFSLPGRFLVLMPGVDSAGVSRKIDDSSQRDRLKKIVSDLRAPEGFGIIVRTAGVGQTKTELQRDLRYLLRLWESVQKGSKNREFPGLVYREADLVIRTIRDHFTPDISEVWIDNPGVYDKALAFVRDVMPTKAKTVKLYTGDRPLFNKYNLEEQIERIYKRRVPLPSGGEIVIDGTEALTAIDVNTARSKRKADLEDSALQTNTEAATEISRQLSLRDLGGLVVVDFIDMSTARNKQKVERVMREAMKSDKARHDITRISKLGLMEIARQRLKGTKLAASYATCPSCDGHGLIKNVDAAGLAALRKLQSRVTRGDASGIRVGLPPEVASWILNHKREELLRIEQRSGRPIEIVADATLRRHESSFATFPIPEGTRAEPEARPSATDTSRASRAVAEPATAPESTPADDSPAEDKPAEEPTSGRTRTSRRRRSGRGRRSRDAATTDEPAPATTDTAAAADAASPGDDKVVPFPTREADEEPSEPAAETEAGAGDATVEAADAEGAEQARPRRRRRRRRRGRGGDGEAREGGAEAREGGAEAREDGGPERSSDVEVPRGVRSDELMPAAVGAAEGGRRKRGGSRRKSDSSGSRSKSGSRPRRRRKSGSRPASED